MNDAAKMETVIVGIFDDSQDLERADKRLAEAGFEGAVYDKAVGAEESCDVNPVAVGPVLAPGVWRRMNREIVNSRCPVLMYSGRTLPIAISRTRSLMHTRRRLPTRAGFSW